MADSTSGATRARRLIAGAIALHLEGLRADGEPIPEPASQGAWLDVAG